MEHNGGDSQQFPQAGRNISRAHQAMAAGAGGLTSHLSLAPGTERVLVAPESAMPRAALKRVVHDQQRPFKHTGEAELKKDFHDAEDNVEITKIQAQSLRCNLVRAQAESSCVLHALHIPITHQRASTRTRSI